MTGRLAVITTILITAGFGCTTKEKHSAGGEVTWPEMESFHHVMASAYHPFKDSAKLEPLKKNADELASQAEKWANSTVPASANSDALQAKLDKLKIDANELAKKVKAGAPDEELGKSLTALHESFHGIMEMVETEFRSKK